MAKSNIRAGKHIAIDIGTYKTRVYVDGLGIIFNQASLMAVDYKINKVIAYGDNAKKYIGILNGNLKVIKLVKRGVVTNLDLLKNYLNYTLSKHKEILKTAYVTLACPVNLTELERNSLIEAIKSLGVAHVKVEDDIKLALMGAGIDISGPEGYLCLDIGCGKTTIALVSTNTTIASKTSKYAGAIIDEEIIKFLKAKKSVIVGEKTAEAVKIGVACLLKPKETLKVKAYGYDLTSALPKELEINDNDIIKIVQFVFGNLADTVTSLIEELSNESAIDVIKNGIIVTGGLASIYGIKTFFEKYFEIPVKVARNASSAVIDGAIAHKETTIKSLEYELGYAEEVIY
ncbi:rod shape-determining protein [Spiroplasma turonicum]|uniref:Cell shape determining protein MreB n=1 Tax=Spiroplasma turonicum TaxID=216946 RepID=A0A0K1P8U9_9MOLU|nr:rod shape-determining protein [Spiroplasma turonicum]AKU80322.1 cell shape determining protein MreB [Spiroplasma turonicum]ALX71323.1 cell shape determining protein MreB [Spiroplasma turonicum]